jgi:hypothetical protein
MIIWKRRVAFLPHRCRGIAHENDESIKVGETYMIAFVPPRDDVLKNVGWLKIRLHATCARDYEWQKE